MEISRKTMSTKVVFARVLPIVIMIVTSVLFLSNLNASAALPVLSVSDQAWSSTTAYPIGVWAQPCVTSDDFIYCVGGLLSSTSAIDVTSAVYYAPLSSSGVGKWTNTTSYPVGIRAESCAATSEEIYCVGGYTNSVISDAVYSAPLSSSGVGQWTATTSYPFPVWAESCTASSAAVICVGGITGPNGNTSAVYFAPISSSGLGQWTNTTSYPSAVYQESCVTAGSYVYCVGGLGSTGVYYTQVTASGVGQWNSTTGYPFTQGTDYPSCVVLDSSILCVGGYTGPTISNDVYQAPISSSGVGEWTSANNYPVGVWAESCVASGGIYCVGGESTGSAVLSNVYYISGPSSITSSPTSSASVSTTASSSASTSGSGSSGTSSISWGYLWIIAANITTFLVLWGRVVKGRTPATKNPECSSAA